MVVRPGATSSSFRSSVDRFHDVSSYRKGRCRREENEYRDLGPGKYDGLSIMELQQARPKTMGSIIGGGNAQRSVVARKGVNWYPGRRDYPNLGPGVYHQPSRMFLGKKEAVAFLPGSRRGFHCFLNCGRSKRLMGDAVLFKTAKADGEHLGPGSYDIPSTLTNGRRPATAPATSSADPKPPMPTPNMRGQSLRAERARHQHLGGSGSGLGRVATPAASSANSRKRGGTGLPLPSLPPSPSCLEEERAAEEEEEVQAVRALPSITVAG